MKRTDAEKYEALAVQRAMLHASCMAYDQGHHWEALRMATAVYTLVHDHGTNRSILSQLKLKDKVTYGSSIGPINPEHIARANMFTPLVHLYRGEFRPLVQIGLAEGEESMSVRFLSFEEWWQREIIFKNYTATLTRRQLVLSLRNQEGGGHFDEELRNPNYVALRCCLYLYRYSERDDQGRLGPRHHEADRLGVGEGVGGS